jgi:hypothetical protein
VVFLAQVDTFRCTGTNLRGLTEKEFLRGKDRSAAPCGTPRRHSPEPRTNGPDLLVLR